MYHGTNSFKWPCQGDLNDALPLLPNRKYSSSIKGEMVKGRDKSCAIKRTAQVTTTVKGIPSDETVHVDGRKVLRYSVWMKRTMG